MRSLPFFSPLILSMAAPLAFAAESPTLPAEPIAGKGQRLLEETFDRTELGEWKQGVPTFGIESGVLRGTQTRADHGSTIRIERPIQDGVVEFRFRVEDAAHFNAVFDDRNHKGSHAGHICRVSFASKSIRLGDDKEGGMRNDLFEMKKDPARKAELAKQLEGRSFDAPFSLERGRWYHASIEIHQDQMRVCVDGKAVGFLRSPGLAHPSKQLFGFTVSGGSVLFDDVKIWAPPR